jgi:hypothetical protein
VQELPSSQENGSCRHPETGSQVSLVHALRSSQSTGVRTHSPVAGSQASEVQASPSLQRALLSETTHPCPGTQELSVQAL